MKKHPGIWFSIWAMVTTFLLSFELSMLNIQEWIFKSVMFFWGAICVYWITYFHGKWIESIDQKQRMKLLSQKMNKNDQK